MTYNWEDDNRWHKNCIEYWLEYVASDFEDIGKKRLRNKALKVLKNYKDIFKLRENISIINELVNAADDNNLEYGDGLLEVTSHLLSLFNIDWEDLEN